MIDDLARLLEFGERRFGADAANFQHHDQLVACGFLRRDGDLDTIRCPDCDVEHNISVEESDAGKRAFCVRAGWIYPTTAELGAWRAAPEAILMAIASACGAKTSKPFTIANDRLAMIGAFVRRLEGKACRVDLGVAIGCEGDDILPHLWDRPSARLRGDLQLLLTTRDWERHADYPPPKWAVTKMADVFEASANGEIQCLDPMIDMALFEALDAKSQRVGRPTGGWWLILPVIRRALLEFPDIPLDELKPRQIKSAWTLVHPARPLPNSRTVGDWIKRGSAHLRSVC